MDENERRKWKKQNQSVFYDIKYCITKSVMIGGLYLRIAANEIIFLNVSDGVDEKGIYDLS